MHWAINYNLKSISLIIPNPNLVQIIILNIFSFKSWSQLWEVCFCFNVFSCHFWQNIHIMGNSNKKFPEQSWPPLFCRVEGLFSFSGLQIKVTLTHFWIVLVGFGFGQPPAWIILCVWEAIVIAKVLMDKTSPATCCNSKQYEKRELRKRV